MVNRSLVRRRVGRWISTVVCVVLIAPLTGCSITIPGLVGFTGVSSVFTAFFALMPLRSQVGTVIRDGFVGVF
ncbi:MAG TPA: hypothetical protein VJZ71_01400 [Phycisphaerae bacterium]|nr:hypothetical protein [Phycisphaerae bacterium]